MQKFQDWFTQQWVIMRGKKINLQDHSWLIGPFGNLNGIGENFVYQLAQSENLIVERNSNAHGLIPSIDLLNLPESALSGLSPKVIEFYENTAKFDLEFAVKWNSFFKVFGILVNKLFSNRINQLHIPTKNITNTESITSEIITLSDPASRHVKYTVWLRTIKSTGQVIYSGIYGTCKLPCGKSAIKAVFPLPKGNATVIMLPTVGAKGELILDSSGKRFGHAGFYFLLNDSKGNYWSRYIRSFRDVLKISSAKEHLLAEQILTLWNRRVLKFNYKIEKSKTHISSVE